MWTTSRRMGPRRLSTQRARVIVDAVCQCPSAGPSAHRMRLAALDTMPRAMRDAARAPRRDRNDEPSLLVASWSARGDEHRAGERRRRTGAVGPELGADVDDRVVERAAEVPEEGVVPEDHRRAVEPGDADHDAPERGGEREAGRRRGRRQLRAPASLGDHACPRPAEERAEARREHEEERAAPEIADPHAEPMDERRGQVRDDAREQRAAIVTPLVSRSRGARGLPREEARGPPRSRPPRGTTIGARERKCSQPGPRRAGSKRRAPSRRSAKYDQDVATRRERAPMDSLFRAPHRFGVDLGGERERRLQHGPWPPSTWPTRRGQYAP